MTKTPEQEANELVEMFRLYAYDADGHHNTESLYSQRIAIKHVEMLIEVLCQSVWCIDGNFATTFAGKITHYQQVLQILKSNHP